MHARCLYINTYDIFICVCVFRCTVYNLFNLIYMSLFLCFFFHFLFHMYVTIRKLNEKYKNGKKKSLFIYQINLYTHTHSKH